MYCTDCVIDHYMSINHTFTVMYFCGCKGVLWKCSCHTVYRLQRENRYAGRKFKFKDHVDILNIHSHISEIFSMFAILRKESSIATQCHTLTLQPL